MNLKESIELIGRTAVEAKAVQIHRIAGDDRRILIQQGGEREFLELPAPSRRFEAHSLASFVALVGRYSVEGAASIWHDDGEVVGLLDDADCRERVAFSLLKTSAWKTVEEMAGGKSYTQPELVRILRTVLGKCAPASVLAAVRDVKWTKRQGAEGAITSTTHSLGMSVEMAVTGAEHVPDEFEITCAVYGGEFEEHTQTVRAALDAVHAEQKFRLTIMEDGAARAMQTMLGVVATRIGELLQEQRDALLDAREIDADSEKFLVPIFAGRPTLADDTE